MAGLSFEKKRAPQPVGGPAAVSVRVFGAGSASVDGAQVVAAPGQEIQQAVLDHLQRLAISVGAPVRATVHDDLAGCVVPLEVSADGSSRVTGEAVRVHPRPQGTGTPGAARAGAGAPGGAQGSAGQSGPAPVAEGPGTDTRDTTDHSLLADVPPEPTAPTPTPARGFDAVAEEVLGDGPLTETAEGAKLLTGPMGRINEAVRAGRIDAAAELADRTLAEATAVFGPRHAEVLHLLELSAYIAYLAGDPVRAFRLSLDVARLRRQARDGEAAYDNVRSAATAWRAVRDPEEGLRLGRDLIDLWTDLTAEPGPAADDPGPLESARARMVRLTDRAAQAAAQA
ncbi:tetratricopeptide repeat protein [Streptomyces sp. NPDC046870]|uniref:tetratricopeptide repeat protein n=1 Tax=Streptomyces sp. NPDC046870 TaxID=3155135 RepID=UPI003451E7B6